MWVFSAAPGRTEDSRMSFFVKLATREEFDTLSDDELVARMVERTDLDRPRARELLLKLRASVEGRSRARLRDQPRTA